MDIGLIGNFDYKNYLQSLKLNGSRDIGENFFTSVNEQIKNISQYDNSSKSSEKKELCNLDIYNKVKVSALEIKLRTNKICNVEQVSPDKEIPNDKLKNIGMTSFGLSDTESQIVLASYVKTSKEDDPVVQVAYGHGDNRKVYHVHVNDVDISNASDLEMFAFMSYEGYKGRTAPNSINNYSAYKTMKADAGYGMASTDENSFVNKKVNADYLLEQIYDSLKKRETEQEAKSFDVCEYLLQMIKNR